VAHPANTTALTTKRITDLVNFIIQKPAVILMITGNLKCRGKIYPGTIASPEQNAR
jgi:hypothetical protein